MKEQSPSFIRSVRVEDLVLGSNPIRILSVNVLPDSVDIGGVGLAEEGNFIVSRIAYMPYHC